MKTKLIAAGLVASVSRVGHDVVPQRPLRPGAPLANPPQPDALNRPSGAPRASTQAMRLQMLLSGGQPQRSSPSQARDTPDLTKASGDTPEPQTRLAEKSKPPAQPGSVLERFDYSKGDQAQTIEAFKQALQGDYTVSFNEHALNPEKFSRRITVYGEDHTNPNLPSIAGERGVVMFESQDPERCIQKYTALDSNRCISIDSPDLSSEQMAFDRLKSAYFDVLDEVGPNAVRDVEAQLSERPTVQEFMLTALSYIKTKMASIVASGDDALAERIMGKLEAAAAVSGHAMTTIKSGLDVRDDHMFEQALSNIQALSADEAATIVVGDAHADKLFDRLAQAFPDRAVVKCRVVHDPR